MAIESYQVILILDRIKGHDLLSTDRAKGILTIMTVIVSTRI